MLRRHRDGPSLHPRAGQRFQTENEGARRPLTRSGALLGVSPLREFFQDLAVESRQVIRSTAGYQPAIDDNFAIFPKCSGVDQVFSYRPYGGHFSSFHHLCIDKDLWAMAYRRHWLSLLKERAYKFECLFIGPSLVRIKDAPGYQQRVIVVCIRFIERLIHR